MFFQFLDCVHQLLRQFPNDFEFTELFLLHLHEHTTSGLFGTFMYNNERERVLDASERRTASVWPSLLRKEEEADHATGYTNSAYKMTGGGDEMEADGSGRRRLRPRTGPAHLVPWENAFSRWLTMRNPSATTTTV